MSDKRADDNGSLPLPALILQIQETMRSLQAAYDS